MRIELQEGRAIGTVKYLSCTLLHVELVGGLDARAGDELAVALDTVLREAVEPLTMSWDLAAVRGWEPCARERLTRVLLAHATRIARHVVLAASHATRTAVQAVLGNVPCFSNRALWEVSVGIDLRVPP